MNGRDPQWNKEGQEEEGEGPGRNERGRGVVKLALDHNPRVVKLALDHNPTLNGRDPNGAKRAGQEEEGEGPGRDGRGTGVVKLALYHNPTVNGRDPNGAKRAGQEEEGEGPGRDGRGRGVVKLALDHNPTVNGRDPNGTKRGGWRGPREMERDGQVVNYYWAFGGGGRVLHCQVQLPYARDPEKLPPILFQIILQIPNVLSSLLPPFAESGSVSPPLTLTMKTQGHDDTYPPYPLSLPPTGSTSTHTLLLLPSPPSH